MNKFITIFFFAIASLLLIACGGEKNPSGQTGDNDTLYGEVLDIALNQEISDLDPLLLIDGYSVQVSNQIFEGLVKFNSKDLSIEPLLASSWEVDKDGLTYTFQLKKGVFFHDNECFESGKGKEFKAADVAFTFNRICNDLKSNYAYNILKNKLVGAIDCHNSQTINEVSGIKVINEYTISFSLIKPSSNFLHFLATPSLAIVPIEAEKNGKLEIVGTGPFVYTQKSNQKAKIELERNPNYHLADENGNKLPYLDGVTFHIVPSSQDRLKQFEEKTLDIITDLPSQSIKNVVEKQIADFESKPPKFILGRYPELVSTYLAFSTKSEPFNNVKVRKAIAMSINKIDLVNIALNGEAYGPALNGIIPPSVSNYDYESIIGIENNVEKAKKLLAEAGYKNGENFPSTKLFIAGNEGQTLRVALDIQKQLLSKLNIKTEIVTLTFTEKSEMPFIPDASMALNAWLADIPTADNFLNIGYGGYVSEKNDISSFPNTSRFENKEYDLAYDEAISTLDDTKRKELCLKAEQILINESPVIPLWYNENYRLFQSNIVNYQPNVMYIHDLTTVRIVDLQTPKSQVQ